VDQQLKVSATFVTKKFAIQTNKSNTIRGRFTKTEKEDKDFWALRGVSFDVFSGEAIGLIGTNGSGKSTLSNIIAGISEPTTGEMIINGKASIIAIKSGLKNELTGRENIKLKCLLSGMKMKEIDAITDDIIAFSDLDDFIDQPLQTYSSGMRSRLGFAISVYQDPDILIIDEALSVGDDTFYQRCVDKIMDFKAQGRTIFFVSHSIKQIRNLCDRVLWLHDGEMMQFGTVDEVTNAYQEYVDWYKSLPKEEQRAHKKERKVERKEYRLADYYQQVITDGAEEARARELFYHDNKTSNCLSRAMKVGLVMLTLMLMGLMVYYVLGHRWQNNETFAKVLPEIENELVLNSTYELYHQIMLACEQLSSYTANVSEDSYDLIERVRLMCQK